MADNSLPNEIVQSIAISNAESIGEQPAILANLALANQILNTNLQQQIAVSNQQAMNQIAMATLAKCVSVILERPGGDPEQLNELLTVLKNVYEGSRQLTQAALPAVPAAAMPASVAASEQSGAAAAHPIAPEIFSNLVYSNLIQNVNLSQQNAVANQQAMNQLALSILGKTVNALEARLGGAATGDKPAPA